MSNIQTEKNDWIKYPMKQGKLYYGICDREVVREECVYHFFSADEIDDVVDIVRANSVVFFLEKKVVAYASTYHTFIKVLTAAGNIGWVIWFKNEWNEIRT